MKNLFLWVLTALNKHGKIIEAIMHNKGDYSSVTAEYEGKIYTISITEKINGNGRN